MSDTFGSVYASTPPVGRTVTSGHHRLHGRTGYASKTVHSITATFLNFLNVHLSFHSFGLTTLQRLSLDLFSLPFTTASLGSLRRAGGLSPQCAGSNTSSIRDNVSVTRSLNYSDLATSQSSSSESSPKSCKLSRSNSRRSLRGMGCVAETARVRVLVCSGTKLRASTVVGISVCV
jgi:hypothetical protein